jgi:hypothetical protein
LEEIVQKSFNYLHAHSACPAMEAFAIDEENPALELEMNDREFFESPLHCYLKGRVDDGDGTTHVVASPVTLAELRATTDYADIMDWHSDWTEENEAMGRVPGRFNNMGDCVKRYTQDESCVFVVYHSREPI